MSSLTYDEGNELYREIAQLCGLERGETFEATIEAVRKLAHEVKRLRNMPPSKYAATVHWDDCEAILSWSNATFVVSELDEIHAIVGMARERCAQSGEPMVAGMMDTAASEVSKVDVSVLVGDKFKTPHGILTVYRLLDGNVQLLTPDNCRITAPYEFVAAEISHFLWLRSHVQRGER